ncbi:MAG: hypothetical protein P1T08_13345 [Acidimicrobiia bacterium]|nr:hypothetical protein [Acidimicrobiia bacterium]
MRDDRNTALDPIYLRTVLRVNLSTSLFYFGLFLLVILGGPIVFWLFPSLATTYLWSLPLPWLFLGVAGFPMLVLIAWSYLGAVEEDEDEFSDLVDTP